MKVTRIWSDGDGVSHFGDFAVRTAPVEGTHHDDSPGVQVANAFLRTFPPEAVNTWHTPAQRQFVVILDGSTEVETGDGEKRRFGPGDVIFAEDMEEPGHVTRGGPQRRFQLHLVVPPDFTLDQLADEESTQ